MRNARSLSWLFGQHRRGQLLSSPGATAPADGRHQSALYAAKRWSTAAVVVTLLCAIPTTSALAFSHRPKPISAASAFVLPSSTRCVAGRKLTVQVRALRGVTWVAANIYVNGRHFKTIKRSQITQPVRLTGLPSGRFVLTITAKAKDGRSVAAKRTYRTCVTPRAFRLSVALAGGAGRVTGTGFDCPGTCSRMYPAGTRVILTAAGGSASSFSGWSGSGCSGTGTCTVTMSSDRSVTASFRSHQSPGSYSGVTHQGYAATFYVSADGSHVQDVSIPTVVIGCTPTKSFSDQLDVASIPIAADGSFTSTTTQSGVLSGAHATFTYTLSGQFSGTTAAGTFREDIAFNNGTAYSCTSNLQSWSMTRDTQGSQAASPPLAGSYSGVTHQGYAATFYVSADGSHVQDVSIPTVVIGCTPTNSFSDQLDVASIPIAGDGSFTSTTTQTGVLSGVPATFTYTFSGHFHGFSASGVERVAGQLREDITFNNGTAYSCTSDLQSWSMTRDTQGSQAASPPLSGSYSGVTHQGYAATFYVSADGSHVQDVSIPTVVIGCTPTNSFSDQLDVASIPIAADGSFTSTTTQTGVLSGVSATFTYTFSGHFHGFTATGTERVAGQLREDITFNNGTAYSCTSDLQSWSMTRDTQGSQTGSPPPGSYSGVTHQGYGATFTVSADSTHILNVSIPTVVIGCTPTKSLAEALDIASIPIAADGSFTSTTTQTGVLSGASATFTYTFSGHFHGFSASGVERVAGQFREDIVFNNGTSYSCTSNDQSWTATH